MKRKKKKKTKNSQPEPKAVAPVVSGKNPTLAPCSKRLKYSAFDWSSHIPREIMHHIFLFLPASLLHEIVRFVCKDWNAIISDPFFIRAHLLQSMSSPATTGILFQDNELDDAKLKRAFYVHPSDRVVSVLELPFEALILDSCNGLLLLQNAIIAEQLFVVNLVTKANIIKLPPLPLTLPKVLVRHRPSAVLAFAPSSGRYKVLHACLVAKYPPSQYPSPEEFYNDRLARFEAKVMVWTIDVDETWRAIDCQGQGITMSKEAKQTLASHPFSIAGGYVCWFDIELYLGFFLDIDAETMYQFAGPEDRVNETCIIPIMDTGGAGIIHMQFPCESWEVWEIIGPKNGGPWGRCMNFDAAGMYSALERHFNTSLVGCPTPLVMCLKTGEFWLCGFVDDDHALVCYNWKTGNIFCASPLRWRRYFDFAHLYVNSLLSLKNLYLYGGTAITLKT